MKKGTRLASLAISALLVLSAMTGCGSSTTGSSSAAAQANSENGASAAAPAGKTVVTFWNGFTGSDRTTLESLVKKYNETNDKNVEIQMEIMPWDSLYQKLATVLSVGQGPDILAFATERIGTYAESGALASLDDVYSQKYVDSSVVPVALDENLKYKGTYYGVPMNFATLLLYYNKTILKEAGLDPAAPPKDWDELEKYALQITEKTGKYGFGMATSETTPMWPIMLWGNGGSIMDDQGKCVLNSKENVETVTRGASLIRDKKIGPATSTGAEIDKLFESQKLAMYFCGPWATTGFKQAGIDFGVAQAPKGPKEQVTQGNAVGMYMTATSKNKDAVYDFFKWWNSKDTQVEWSLGTGFPLARTDALDDPRLASNPYIAEFSKPANSSKFYLQQLTNFADVDTQGIVPAFEAILLQNADVQSTLNDATQTIDSLTGK